MPFPFAARSSKHEHARRPVVGLFTGATAALAATLALSSCAVPEVDSSNSGSGLRVVTTTTQLADFATEVGGDDITLNSLMQPGASAHHFEPSPADLLALGQADVLVVNGVDLESFIDSAIEASGFSGDIVTASDGIDLEAAAHVSEHEHEHEHEHAEAPASHDEHDGHDHDGHDHGPVNPHIWTSVRLAEGMVDEVARGFATADPDHANDYEQRAAQYNERLHALDAWAAAEFERVPEASRVLVTGHDSLSYYLNDYDIAFAGAILPSFEDNAEPSAAEIDALIAHIKQLGVPAIFVESSMSPKLARTIARESGAKVVDAEALYADALGATGSGADTYIDATAHNTRVILEAWGFDPDPLPANIAGANAAAAAEAEAKGTAE